jgi:hypothetical protein
MPPWECGAAAAATCTQQGARPGSSQVLCGAPGALAELLRVPRQVPALPAALLPAQLRQRGLPQDAAAADHAGSAAGRGRCRYAPSLRRCACSATLCSNLAALQREALANALVYNGSLVSLCARRLRSTRWAGRRAPHRSRRTRRAPPAARLRWRPHPSAGRPPRRPTWWRARWASTWPRRRRRSAATAPRPSRSRHGRTGGCATSAPPACRPCIGAAEGLRLRLRGPAAGRAHRGAALRDPVCLVVALCSLLTGTAASARGTSAWTAWPSMAARKCRPPAARALRHLTPASPRRASPALRLSR